MTQHQSKLRRRAHLRWYPAGRVKRLLAIRMEKRVVEACNVLTCGSYALVLFRDKPKADES